MPSHRSGQGKVDLQQILRRFFARRRLLSSLVKSNLRFAVVKMINVFRMFCGFAWILAAVAVSTARAQDFQGSTHVMPFDEDTLSYTKAQPDDPVSQLQRRIEQGELKLKYGSEHGYLDSVLKELGIPKSSQVLVFSKTSLQRDRISPRTPRALFFNDDVYIGFIPGSPLMEISTADPKLGGVFYTLDQSKSATQKFARTDQCLECHASGKSMGVPGHLLRSVETDGSGVADLSSSISEVNHRTPIEDRWGGYYVTGEHGDQLHRGNLIGKDAFAKQEKNPNYLGNISDLNQFFDGDRYPAQSSDIVALLVLEHQVHMHNFITRLNYESQVQLARYGHINYVTNIANSFLKYLLFTEEAPIKSRIEGNSSFAKDFSNLGPKDSNGRSLRDFDLETRLFKYPCSYLLYSKSFDALSGKMKEHVYQRLWDVLTGKDESADFANLSRKDKRAILEILIETKRGLPEYWNLNSPPG